MSSDVTQSTGSRFIEAIEASSSEIGLRARAKVKTRPSIVYEILTDPNSISIFRNMKARNGELVVVAWSFTHHLLLHDRPAHIERQ